MSKRFNDGDIGKVIEILKTESEHWDVPVVSFTANATRDPFRVLISTILSLRTKDETTAKASKRLFEKAETPEEILSLGKDTVRELIYPVGFYKRKAENIIDICKKLVREYDSRVPDELDELLEFKGVGRKTANLVITLGYRKPGICVDTHVHRICNRLGYVSTRDPDETERELRKKLPEKYWIDINYLLVAFGQHLCRPVSPVCSVCPVERYCMKNGVTTHR